TTMDSLPGEDPGMAYAEIINQGIEDVLVITMVEYQEDYNGENLILIQIGKKHFGEPPPPAQVKTPQVRWAGEKIVLEKDWSGIIGDCIECKQVIALDELEMGESWYIAVFNREGESIGNLEAIEAFGIGALDMPDIMGLSLSADQVITFPDEDGIVHAILATEQQGQADVNVSLYEIYCGIEGLYVTGPIDEHGFVVYFLAFEDVNLAEDITPEDSLRELKPAVEEADVAVRVRGWFTSSALPPTARAAEFVDINGDGTYDIMLPAGRYILPDDWPVLAGFNYTLRPNFDLMDQAHLDDITATDIGIEATANGGWFGIVDYYGLGPFDSGVVTTDPPDEAEFPNIGPFSGLQVWSSEDVWIAQANIDSSLPTGFERNTVVPDGMITMWDAPMPQALVIFDVVSPDGTFSEMFKDLLEGYGIMDNLYQSPFYAVEVPSSPFLPASGYNWDSWGWEAPYPYWWDLHLESIISDTHEDPIEWKDVEVYTDNHGIAGVVIDELDESGEVTITATAEYPYTPFRGKFASLTSEEITATWGQLELDSYFEAWPRAAEEGPLTVTFTNLSVGGVPPYVATVWDFGDGTIEANTAMQPGMTTEHTYATAGSYVPSLTITDQSQPQPLVSVETKEADYILIGEAPPPMPDEPTVEAGLDSISDYLVSVYSYKTGEGTDGWTVYNPTWPAASNTLETMFLGRGYWINVSQACTLQYGTHTYDELSVGWNLIGWLGK
ncbi:PKD domain-containing protein, partial [Chloroflexota bacterium]